ncbi:hypothetical protein D3C78_1807390 [compost metagenome]
MVTPGGITSITVARTSSVINHARAATRPGEPGGLASMVTVTSFPPSEMRSTSEVGGMAGATEGSDTVVMGRVAR